MALLRRVLYLGALLLGASGVLLLVAPGTAFLDLAGQPGPVDPAVLRLLGVSLGTLALVMVMVAHRVEDLWWWSWAFVLLQAGTAAVATLHGAFGLPLGAPSWPWWALAVTSWALAGGLLWGIGRAGIERPSA